MLLFLSSEPRFRACGGRNLGAHAYCPPENRRDAEKIGFVLGVESTYEDERKSILLVSSRAFF